MSWVILQSKQLHESPSRDDQTRSKFDLPTRYGILEKLKISSTGILVVKINVVLFFCFPSHNQNERNVRDMASYNIKAVMLDNHVEGSLPKCLAKEMGLALFLDLPNL